MKTCMTVTMMVLNEFMTDTKLSLQFKFKCDKNNDEDIFYENWGF